jgi:hypothetical protein
MMAEFKYALAPLEDALDIMVHEINKLKKRVTDLENVPPLTIKNHLGEVLTVVPFGETASITAEKE